VQWIDLSCSVISISEKSEHYQEILDTGARQNQQRDHINELADAYDAYDRLVRPGS
jgi:hypothetical protein